jgi:glycosyltransferase involved in cell wall biosynthesis
MAIMDNQQLPKVSVITVVCNGEKFIEKTIKSVISQDYPSIEYIIVDGDSQDNTNQIINNYREYLSQYVSEPDDGIYDAMNKGARLASGEWVLYMNAGDYFYNHQSLSHLQTLLNSDADVILAGVEEVLVDDLQTRYFQRMPRPVSEIWRYMPTSHQATLARLSCQLKYGFDTSYVWCGDHDLLARMYRDGRKFVSENILFCVFDCNGDNVRDTMLFIRERYRLSKGLVPAYRRWLQYGSEWMHCRIWGKIVGVVKFFLPSRIILELRKWRSTTGVRAS